MPYRIYATNNRGNTITRMDLDPESQPINNKQEAELLAERFADQQTHGGPWRGRVEYYETPTANPLWNRTNNALEDPVYDRANVKLKAKPGKVPVYLKNR